MAGMVGMVWLCCALCVGQVDRDGRDAGLAFLC